MKFCCLIIIILSYFHINGQAIYVEVNIKTYSPIIKSVDKSLMEIILQDSIVSIANEFYKGLDSDFHFLSWSNDSLIKVGSNDFKFVMTLIDTVMKENYRGIHMYSSLAPLVSDSVKLNNHFFGISYTNGDGFCREEEAVRKYINSCSASGSGSLLDFLPPLLVSKLPGQNIPPQKIPAAKVYSFVYRNGLKNTERDSSVIRIETILHNLLLTHQVTHYNHSKKNSYFKFYSERETITEYKSKLPVLFYTIELDSANNYIIEFNQDRSDLLLSSHMYHAAEVKIQFSKDELWLNSSRWCRKLSSAIYCIRKLNFPW